LKDTKLLRKPLSAKIYFTLISTYLDSVVSKRKVDFSRIEITKYINENVNEESIINLVDIEVTFLIKNFYLKQATTEQQELIRTYFVKDHIESEKAIDPLAVDTIPIALFYDQLIKQKDHLHNQFTDLEQKTPILTIDSFNSNLENLDNVMKQLVIKEVISLTGTSKVNAVYKYALSVYDTHIQMIKTYHYMKKEVQRLFNDFSELRDNLRYAREDLFFITSSLLQQELSKEELNIFDFKSVQWLEYAEIQDRLDLQFDKIKDHCSTFYSVLNENFIGTSNAISKGIDNIGKNMGKKNYNHMQLKGDLVVEGLNVAFNVVSGVIKSRSDSKLTIENLHREIEFLKLSFTEDKVKLQVDLIRLIELFNTVKNVFIPITKKYNELFFSVLEKNFSKDLKYILDYNGLDTKIKEKSELLMELRYIDIYLLDIKNISKELKKPLSQTENEYYDQYDYYNFTLKQEPKEISDLTLYLTLGWANAYKEVYYDEWKKAKAPIEQHFYQLKSKYEKEHTFWQYNDDSYSQLNERKNTINSRLAQLKIEIKNNLINLSNKSDFLNKKELLLNIAKSSRTILETSINENLISPEQFASSLELINIEQVIDDDSSRNDNLNNKPKDDTTSIYEKINKLLDQLEDMSSLDLTISKLSQSLFEKIGSNQISKNDIEKTLYAIMNHYNLEDLNYTNFEEVFTTILVNETPLDYAQITQAINLAKHHFIIMEQVIRMREEIKLLKSVNISNDIQINKQINRLIQQSKGKIFKENDKTHKLFIQLDNKNISDIDKLNLFN